MVMDVFWSQMEREMATKLETECGNIEGESISPKQVFIFLTVVAKPT